MIPKPDKETLAALNEARERAQYGHKPIQNVQTGTNKPTADEIVRMLNNDLTYLAIAAAEQYVRDNPMPQDEYTTTATHPLRILQAITLLQSCLNTPTDSLEAK